MGPETPPDSFLALNHPRTHSAEPGDSALTLTAGEAAHTRTALILLTII